MDKPNFSSGYQSGKSTGSLNQTLSNISVFPIEDLWESRILDRKYQYCGYLSKKGTGNAEVLDAVALEDIVDEFG